MGDLDLSGNAVGLHAAGHVHRVAPDIVVKFLPPNHASDHRTGTNTDTKAQLPSVVLILVDVGTHLQRQTRQGMGVIRTWEWRTSEVKPLFY